MCLTCVHLKKLALQRNNKRNETKQSTQLKSSQWATQSEHFYAFVVSIRLFAAHDFTRQFLLLLIVLVNASLQCLVVVPFSLSGLVVVHVNYQFAELWAVTCGGGMHKKTQRLQMIETKSMRDAFHITNGISSDQNKKWSALRKSLCGSCVTREKIEMQLIFGVAHFCFAVQTTIFCLLSVHCSMSNKE